MKAPISIILALMLFALPAAIAAMATFERLQESRIEFFDEFVSDLHPDGPHALSPEYVARYAYWLGRAGYPVPADARRRVLFARHPQEVAETKLTLVSTFFAGSLLAWTLLWVLSYRRRVLPLAASHGERFWAVIVAMRTAWLWSMAAAVVTAAIVWYVGFARDEQSVPLEEGMWPRRMQLAFLVGGWCVVSLATCVALLPRSLARVVGPAMADREVCRRCGYSLVGLDGRNCPECGGTGVPARWHEKSPRVRNRQLSKRVIISFTVAAALLAGTATISSRAQNWLLLRPRYTFPQFANVGWIAIGEAPQRWTTAYGVLVVSAEYHEGTGEQSPLWTFAWMLEPVAAFKPSATEGKFDIPVTYGTLEKPDLHLLDIPCGQLAFYSMKNDPRLHVLGPAVVFSHMGHWGRPVPPPPAARPVTAPSP